MGKHAKRNTNYLDCDSLLQQYQPLIGSIYKKFSSYNGIFHSPSDYEDLKAQIEMEFVRLWSEYDPTRGVDFPGFIKFHLQQRVYHYVTKLQRRVNVETTSFGKTFEDSDSTLVDFDNTLDLIDENSIKAFERVEALASLDWRAIVGKKHKHLIESILYEGKTIEEIASQEGVVVKVIRLRLHFACERLKQWYQKQQEYGEYQQDHPDVTFEDFLAVKRQEQKIKREPIFIIRTPITQKEDNINGSECKLQECGDHGLQGGSEADSSGY